MDLDELKSKKIGYTPVDRDFTTAGDRRRFIYFAEQLGLNWEFCKLDNSYDIVYITTIANITDWINYKKSHPNTVLIFDINNSFFFNQNPWWNFLRGFSRFIFRRERKFYLNYNNVYHEMFKYADIIVCPTDSAMEYISQFNSNVYTSFDYFENEIKVKKTDFKYNNPLIIVWEGMGVTAKHILNIAPVLEKYKGKVKLRLITDRKYKLGGLFNVDVVKLFSKAKFDYEFIDWEKDSFSKHIAEADVAVIPLDKSDRVALHKPENKLILFWQHGIPVLTTDTPAYVKAFSEVDYNLTCSDLKEWESKLELFISGEFNSKQHIDSVNHYLQKHRSREKFMVTWGSIFEDALKILKS